MIGIQRADHDAVAAHGLNIRRFEETYVDWVWEILRYVAAWGGTGLIIWFWYWMFSNIGTF